MKRKFTDFYFNLPRELIAQEPLKRREDSRMLVLKKGETDFVHDRFVNIESYLKKGDILVINNTRVIPVRLKGIKKETRGKVELTLIAPLSSGRFSALSNKKLKEGTEIIFSENLSAKAAGKTQDGKTVIEFKEADQDELLQKIEKIGIMPLPPYIKRPDNRYDALDKERYQTIYAKTNGAVAAPTAGLHFSEAVLKKLKAKGVGIVSLTLHVGLGTFIPLKTEYIEDHIMHAEYYKLDKEAADTVNEARARGSRVVCVGTTAARVLETVADSSGRLKEAEGYTDIYIYPPYRFKCVTNLLTNFHLPDSTLILLVSALAGTETIKKAYAEAIQREYRFFSYGDCMLILE